MASNNNMIRMSGMNSGLDTESIINALTANSKLKITKQNRQLLKYQATQEAYREVISKMQSLKSKYFDLLNPSSNLKGTSMWSKYTTTTSINGEEKKMKGFSVTTSIDSTPGEYKVKVLSNATQATMTGSPLSSAASLKLDDLTAGETYGMSITVGGETKNITFTADADKSKTQYAINSQLVDLFGESNESIKDNDEGNANVLGLVYMDENGKFISRESKGLSVTDAAAMKGLENLDLNNLKTGNNTVSIQIGEQTLNVSFQTLAKGYLDWDIDETEYDDEGNIIRSHREMTDKEKGKLYTEVFADYVESKKYEQYNTWKSSFDAPENATDEEKAAAALSKENALKELKDEAFTKAEAKQREKYLDKYLNQEYDKYVKENNLKFSNDKAKEEDFKLWKSQYKEVEGNTLYEGFKNFYETHDISATLTTEQIQARDEKLDQYLDTKYEEYRDNGGTMEDKAAWKAGVLNESNTELYNKDIADGYKAVADKYNTYTGYELDRDLWESVSYNEYEAFKDSSRCTVSESSILDDRNFNNDVLVDHFNRSALKNSLGEASMITDEGVVNFRIDMGKDSDPLSSLKIEAELSRYEYEYETEVDGNGDPLKDGDGNIVYKHDANGKKIAKTDENGDPILAKKNGKPYLAEEADDAPDLTKKIDFALTSSRKSVSDFGVKVSSNSVSQISNSTLISDLGVEAKDGKYEFSINGVNFKFDEDTTVKDMMRQINASAAGVKLTYSSLENRFTMTSNEYGVNSSIKLDDGQGLLGAIGLDTSKLVAGSNLMVEINGKTLQSGTNSVELDGNKFTFTGVEEGTEFEVNIEKDYSAIKDTIKSFVEEYNKLIEDVYKLLDEKPDKDYYFLADADKEDMDLSEKQEEKWEAKAKLGLLYHDTTITSAMTKLRTSLLGFITGADGNDVSLSTIGIKSASDYKEHGKLVLDEDTLEAAIREKGEDIARLFTDKENGIMVKFSEALEAAVGTTGDKGTLINKAGLATGATATNNFIYNQMKRITQNISRLERRYEKEQDRLWKKYSAMESMLGTMNSQSASFSSYFGGTM